MDYHNSRSVPVPSHVGPGTSGRPVSARTVAPGNIGPSVSVRGHHPLVTGGNTVSVTTLVTFGFLGFPVRRTVDTLSSHPDSDTRS